MAQHRYKSMNTLAKYLTWSTFSSNVSPQSKLHLIVNNTSLPKTLSVFIFGLKFNSLYFDFTSHTNSASSLHMAHYQFYLAYLLS